MKKRAEATQPAFFFLSGDISVKSGEDTKEGLIDRTVNLASTVTNNNLQREKTS